MHVSLQGAARRCITDPLPASDAATQTEEQGAVACFKRSCIAIRRKLTAEATSAQAEVSIALNKLRTSDVKAEREWRGMVHECQAETAEAVAHLREAETDRHTRWRRIGELEAQCGELQEQVWKLRGQLEDAVEAQEAAEARALAVEAGSRAEKQQVLRDARKEFRATLEAERRALEAERREQRDEMEAAAEAAAAAADAVEERNNKWYSELRNARRTISRAQKRQDDLLEKVAPVYRESALALTNRTHDNRRQKWYRCFSNWLKSCEWDDDSVYALAKALFKTGLLDAMWGSRWMDIVFIAAVEELHAEMERDIFGVRFGLYLHLEMHLTLPQIVEMSLVTSKVWNGKRYGGRYVYESPGSSSRELKLRPIRITPTRCELEAELLERKAGTNLEMSEDGRVTSRPFLPQVGCLLAEDCGKNGMPPLSDFIDGSSVLDIKLSADATGFGALQLSLLTLGNVYSAQSAQTLRILGGGNCDDGRSGVLKLLGDNHAIVNQVIRTKGKTPFAIPFPNGEVHMVRVNCVVVSDLSCLRHCEKQLNSGMCGCAATALRVVPKKPSNHDELRAHTRRCFRPSLKQRTTLRHARQLDGSIVPCFASGCTFGHSDNPELELTVALQHEARLLADQTKKGIAAHTKWRLEHGHAHYNTQPHSAGEGTFDVDLSSQQYLCNLHGPLLNLPKHSPWSHGILRNASDDGCTSISETLKLMKHPLDCRKKDAGRVKQEKWFTGERYQTFVKGGRGSPGGPKAIAQIVMCLATDLVKHRDRVDPSAPMAGPPKVSRGAGKGGVASRFIGFDAPTTSSAPVSQPAIPTHAELTAQARARTEQGRIARIQLHTAASAPARQPTALELACDDDDLALIRRHYGSFAQLVINALLVWDGAFALFWVQSERIGWRCPAAVSVKHALDLCRASIDLHEISERVSLQQCKSWYNHLWEYCMIDHILLTGEPLSISDLELLNGLLKRTAKSNATTRIELSDQAKEARAEAEAAAAAEDDADEGEEGDEEQVVVSRKPYASTMSWQVITFLVLQQQHRKDDDAIKFRTAERLFGEHGSGRSSLPKKQKMVEPTTAVLFAKALETYSSSAGKVDVTAVEPRADTCVKAFCRLLKFAEAQAAQRPNS